MSIADRLRIWAKEVKRDSPKRPKPERVAAGQAVQLAGEDDIGREHQHVNKHEAGADGQFQIALESGQPALGNHRGEACEDQRGEGVDDPLFHHLPAVSCMHQLARCLRAGHQGRSGVVASSDQPQAHRSSRAYQVALASLALATTWLAGHSSEWSRSMVFGRCAGVDAALAEEGLPLALLGLVRAELACQRQER